MTKKKRAEDEVTEAEYTDADITSVGNILPPPMESTVSTSFSTDMVVADTAPPESVAEVVLDHAYEEQRAGGKHLYDFWAPLAFGSLPPREFERLNGVEQNAWASLFGYVNGR